jgi:molecular chaperone GrpE (heat shock protein)
MLPLPPVIAWTLAAIGAVAVSKVLAREWRRVNAELDAQEQTSERASEQASEQASETVARDELPTLRRDPVSGVYRPQ